MIDFTSTFSRFPFEKNPTLKAWNAADEFALHYFLHQGYSAQNPIIYGDRFGFLTFHLNAYSPDFIVVYKSQEDALGQQFNINNSFFNGRSFKLMEDAPMDCQTGIIHMPKSIDLFEVYVSHFCTYADPNASLIIGFMTRHFTSHWLTFLSSYFSEVTQTKAQKKARLILCRGIKKRPTQIFSLSSYRFEQHDYDQYPGVFSKNHIDPATLFLLENLSLEQNEKKLLDIGCGNGIIGIALKYRFPWLEVTGVDDNVLAVASAKRNDVDAHWIWDYHMHSLTDEGYDVIVSNPPFHFEHETDVTMAWQLFEEASRKLRPGGRMILVYNKHLNYPTQLMNYFPLIKILASNQKYEITACWKAP